MKTKIIIILSLLAFAVTLSFAQTQQGYVKTIGRPDKPGIVLGDVERQLLRDGFGVNLGFDGLLAFVEEGEHGVVDIVVE